MVIYEKLSRELTSSPWMKVTVLVGETLRTAASSTQAGPISASLQRLKASDRASDTLVSSRPSGMTNLKFAQCLNLQRQWPNKCNKRIFVWSGVEERITMSHVINREDNKNDRNIIILTIKTGTALSQTKTWRPHHRLDNQDPDPPPSSPPSEAL